ncbi:MAG: hypothetical protein C4B59_12135 [Candidatus Methanogaster sp.]|uniref:Uncharacterized protein n=1 Tax=Candidatus Methanogaster sp. TaxID=3386292 RepID=A0AC61L0L3_9EURY|nr:MAG: hypothetical protein C4B59_12135 [ANME-2 cluster archaeon]
MTEYTVTMIDTAGIQNYIFGSNNLQHNVGASWLVHCATNDWVFEGLVELGKTNVDIKGNIDPDAAIENSGLNSELVYAGGGNTVILFRGKELAIKFTKQITRRVLVKAPGLQLVVCHTDFDWDKPQLTQAVLDTVCDVNKKKHNRGVSSHVLGLGVTADCQYTGLPAVDIHPESGSNPKKNVRISGEIAAKWRSFKDANKELQKKFPLHDEYLEYVSNFNDFGTKHESSYIAVVHTDGNGMGKRVQAISNKYSADNREYVKAIRAFSESVEEQTKKALDASISQLTESIDNGKIGDVNIRDNKLPFRPIVFGGDDVTFVCDGRLGLTLTEFYLRKLTSQDSKLSDKEPISARAGIAIVKSHYPFSRAVTLAEDLAKSAKNYINGRDISAMDWHFAASGPIGSLDDIRKREYTVDDGELYMRPLCLGESVGADWHSWDIFTAIIGEFKRDWSDRRNKLMDLREALRAGPETVEQFVTAYEPHRLPEIKNNPTSSRRTGWVDQRCTCFDAIEAMDFFIPLK